MSRSKPENRRGDETGKPSSRRRKRLLVPIGLEKTLYLAAADQRFHRDLLADRTAAVRRAGFELRESERHILDSIAAPLLEKMVAAIDLELHSRRKFMRNIAIAVAAGAAAPQMMGCDGTSSPSKGSNPDIPEPDVEQDGADAEEVDDPGIESDPIDDSDEETATDELEIDYEEVQVNGIMPDGY